MRANMDGLTTKFNWSHGVGSPDLTYLHFGDYVVGEIASGGDQLLPLILGKTNVILRGNALCPDSAVAPTNHEVAVCGTYWDRGLENENDPCVGVWCEGSDGDLRIKLVGRGHTPIVRQFVESFSRAAALDLFLSSALDCNRCLTMIEFSLTDCSTDANHTLILSSSSVKRLCLRGKVQLTAEGSQLAGGATHLTVQTYVQSEYVVDFGNDPYSSQSTFCLRDCHGTWFRLESPCSAEYAADFNLAARRTVQCLHQYSWTEEGAGESKGGEQSRETTGGSSGCEGTEEILRHITNFRLVEVGTGEQHHLEIGSLTGPDGTQGKEFALWGDLVPPPHSPCPPIPVRARVVTQTIDVGRQQGDRNQGVWMQGLGGELFKLEEPAGCYSSIAQPLLTKAQHFLRFHDAMLFQRAGDSDVSLYLPEQRRYMCNWAVQAVHKQAQPKFCLHFLMTNKKFVLENLGGIFDLDASNLLVHSIKSLEGIPAPPQPKESPLTSASTTASASAKRARGEQQVVPQQDSAPGSKQNEGARPSTRPLAALKSTDPIHKKGAAEDTLAPAPQHGMNTPSVKPPVQTPSAASAAPLPFAPVPSAMEKLPPPMERPPRALADWDPRESCAPRPPSPQPAAPAPHLPPAGTQTPPAPARVSRFEERPTPRARGRAWLDSAPGPIQVQGRAANPAPAPAAPPPDPGMRRADEFFRNSTQPKLLGQAQQEQQAGPGQVSGAQAGSWQGQHGWQHNLPIQSIPPIQPCVAADKAADKPVRRSRFDDPAIKPATVAAATTSAIPVNPPRAHSNGPPPQQPLGSTSASTATAPTQWRGGDPRNVPEERYTHSAMGRDRGITLSHWMQPQPPEHVDLTGPEHADHDEPQRWPPQEQGGVGGGGGSFFGSGGSRDGDRSPGDPRQRFAPQPGFSSPAPMNMGYPQPPHQTSPQHPAPPLPQHPQPQQWAQQWAPGPPASYIPGMRQAAGGVGVGRGRGRESTLPAWMTVQQRPEQAGQLAPQQQQQQQQWSPPPALYMQQPSYVPPPPPPQPPQRSPPQLHPSAAQSAPPSAQPPPGAPPLRPKSILKSTSRFGGDEQDMEFVTDGKRDPASPDLSSPGSTGSGEERRAEERVNCPDCKGRMKRPKCAIPFHRNTQLVRASRLRKLEQERAAIRGLPDRELGIDSALANAKAADDLLGTILPPIEGVSVCVDGHNCAGAVEQGLPLGDQPGREVDDIAVEHRRYASKHKKTEGEGHASSSKEGPIIISGKTGVWGKLAAASAAAPAVEVVKLGDRETDPRRRLEQTTRGSLGIYAQSAAAENAKYRHIPPSATAKPPKSALRSPRPSAVEEGELQSPRSLQWKDAAGKDLYTRHTYEGGDYESPSSDLR